MKKVLIAALSLIMILSLTPLSVAAARVISTVNVGNVLTPAAGVKWEWQWDKSLMVSEDLGYEVYQQPEWYDETEKRFMNNNEAFQVGHIYTVQIWVEVKDGYEFDSTTTVYYMKATVNGKDAEVSKAFEYQRWAMAVVSYTFPEVKDNKKITSVSVSDIKEPKIGKQSIARAHYLKYSEGVTGYHASWYEDYDADKGHFTGIFAAEKAYTFELIMELQEGYDFTYKSTGEPDVAVTFNDRAVSDVSFNGSGMLVARLEYENLGPEKEKVMGIITYGIKEPAVGEKPAFTAENRRSDGMYYIDTENPGSTKDGITWYEGEGGSRRMDENDTFKAGEYYYVAINVKPKDGCLFKTDTKGGLLVTGAINGYNAIISGSEEKLFIGFTFEKLKEAPAAETEKPTETVKQSEKPSETEKPTEKPTETVKQSEKPSETEKPAQTETQQEAPEVAFVDVSKGEYFYDAVLWAVKGDITKGTSDTTFGPAVSCTRGQTVTFLWRAAGSPEPKMTENPFTDVKTDDYFRKAVLWAYENGITKGTSDNLFSPYDTVTRGQTVTFLYRLKGEKTNGKNPFTDIKKGDYYYDSVLWAYEKKITSGTSDSLFSPSDNCLRGQIVTFLYRCNK